MGHVASGFLVTAAGAGWAIAFDGATFFAAALLLSGLRLPSRRLVAGSFVLDLREGWSEVRSHTWLLAVLLQSTLVTSAATAVFLVLGPTIVDARFGGASAWGLILAAMALGYAAGGVIMLRFRPWRPLVVGVAALSLSAPQYAFLAEPVPLAAIMSATFLAGMGFELFGVLWSTTLQERVPADRLARVSSYDSLGSYALFPLALALAGLAAEDIGANRLLWLSAVGVAASTIVVLSIDDVRQLIRSEKTQA